MKWLVAFDPVAEKQFSKLGKSAQRDIERYIAKYLRGAQDEGERSATSKTIELPSTTW